ncbi:TIGR04206 family protein [Halorussus amylolyticus]|uniref:TIGR04206 family protein n=1 Tax=Halorussus amylolyticus TaxID=1126242 RepID=UPI001051D8D0|nr:TIGR04206 family protein [Halorussus amylolyticus]
MRRLLALAALALAPWTVFPTGDFVFAWGLVGTGPIHVTTLPNYLFVYTAGLPQRLLAWPVGVVLYLLAVGSALFGTFTAREDRRVTGGLLILAGASHLWFTLGMSRTGLTGFPTGTLLLWTAAWWFHWPDLRETFLSDA